MGEKELEDIKKEIDKEIEEIFERSEDENLREVFDRSITKVQRPDQWPDPPDDDNND